MLAALRNEKVRGFLFQLLTVVGLVAFLWYIGVNTLHNIEQRGIQTGFGFLEGTAGFGIYESPISFTETDTHARVFLVGLLNTLIVGFTGILLATILGIFIGILRLSNNWLIRKIAAAYIDIFRNIPILLQIFFWYNVVLKSLPGPRHSLEFFDTFFLNNRGLLIPQFSWNSTTLTVLASFVVAAVAIFFLNRWANIRQEKTGEPFTVIWIGIATFILAPIVGFFIGGADFGFSYPELRGFNFSGGKSISPEFLALTFALTIYTATFIAEAVRSGIEAVGKGQKEAAISLSLSPYQTLKLVILPQAIRISIPPIINQYLNLVKNSSLAAAIGYPEIVTVFAGTSLNQVGQAIEIIAITMLVYLTISLSVSAILNWFNHKMKIKER
ncbi:amino acid ABC transporter permease [Sulfurospirillum sp. T05]|uniref:Amino acid ABC transporter permease n=1 Tax=Sulfurospirillum tamanense TaxID=2813362 RepID=A0ABS2WS81_9BACT|nr:amino acid ABC transporter permease [Sulfurospirillum tamanensis]MBN2964533.1 amino acid ABC transporter permease [Sulfurospirillum tamanensis]